MTQDMVPSWLGGCVELPRVGLASRIAVIVYVDVDMSDDRLVQEGQAGRDRVALDRLRHAWERGG